MRAQTGQPFNVSAVVLAAGMSRRMGAHNKLHLEIEGVPLLRRCVLSYLDANLWEIVVVLGHEHESTRRLIDDLPVKCIVNPDFADGQVTSVRSGLAALSSNTNAILIALGDQPALKAAHFSRLIDAFHQHPEAQAAVPYFDGKRGNPVLVSAASRQQILAGRRNVGCRKFIENNPELVIRVDMLDASVLIDLDTPEDFQHYSSGTNPSTAQ